MCFHLLSVTDRREAEPEQPPVGSVSFDTTPHPGWWALVLCVLRRGSSPLTWMTKERNAAVITDRQNVASGIYLLRTLNRSDCSPASWGDGRSGSAVRPRGHRGRWCRPLSQTEDSVFKRTETFCVLGKLYEITQRGLFAVNVAAGWISCWILNDRTVYLRAREAPKSPRMLKIHLTVSGGSYTYRNHRHRLHWWFRVSQTLPTS